jgi:hypothetical protein
MLGRDRQAGAKGNIQPTVFLLPNEGYALRQINERPKTLRVGCGRLLGGRGDEREGRASLVGPHVLRSRETRHALRHQGFDSGISATAFEWPDRDAERGEVINRGEHENEQWRVLA